MSFLVPAESDPGPSCTFPCQMRGGGGADTVNDCPVGTRSPKLSVSWFYSLLLTYSLNSSNKNIRLIAEDVTLVLVLQKAF